MRNFPKADACQTDRGAGKGQQSLDSRVQSSNVWISQSYMQKTSHANPVGHLESWCDGVIAKNCLTLYGTFNFINNRLPQAFNV